MKRRIWLTLLLAAWLESELWINPWLLLAGVSTLVVAVVTFLMYPRRADRPA